MKTFKLIPYNSLHYSTIQDRTHIHLKVRNCTLNELGTIEIPLDPAKLGNSIIHSIVNVFLSNQSDGNIEKIAKYYKIREEDLLSILSYFISNPFVGRYEDAAKVAEKLDKANYNLVAKHSLRKRGDLQYMFKNRAVIYKAIKTYMYTPKISFSEIADYYGWSTIEFQNIIKFAACVLINTRQFNNIANRLISDVGYETFIKISNFRSSNSKKISYLDNLSNLSYDKNKTKKKIRNLIQNDLFKSYLHALNKSTKFMPKKLKRIN